MLCYQFVQDSDFQIHHLQVRAGMFLLFVIIFQTPLPGLLLLLQPAASAVCSILEMVWLVALGSIIFRIAPLLVLLHAPRRHLLVPIPPQHYC